MGIQGNENSFFTWDFKVVLDRFSYILGFGPEDSISHYLISLKTKSQRQLHVCVRKDVVIVAVVRGKNKRIGILKVSNLWKFVRIVLLLHSRDFKTSLMSSRWQKDVVLVVVVRGRDKTSEVYLESSRASMTELFCKI